MCNFFYTSKKWFIKEMLNHNPGKNSPPYTKSGIIRKGQSAVKALSEQTQEWLDAVRQGTVSNPLIRYIYHIFSLFRLPWVSTFQPTYHCLPTWSFPSLKHLHGFLEHYVLVTSFTMRGLLVSGFSKCILSSVTMVLKSKKYRPSRISGTFSGPWEGHMNMKPWSGQR